VGESSRCALLRGAVFYFAMQPASATAAELQRWSAARDVYGIRVAPSKFGFKALGTGSEVIARLERAETRVHVSAGRDRQYPAR
jgi:hypothetical protein